MSKGGGMLAIVDCNNCYASCEEIFEPKLAGKPIIILTNNDGQAIAKNQLAKSLEIDYSIPYHQLKPTLDKFGVVALSSNYTLYGDISARIMRMLHHFCPDMEVYSIDEAFLNFDSFHHANLVNYAKEIRASILNGIGMPVSIGLAQTKTLCKIANRYVKKHNREVGVFAIDSEEKRLELLKLTPINDIWGVGGQLTVRLNKLGIKTAYDLSLVKPDWARRNLTIVGERMIRELNGQRCIELEYIPKRKDIIASQKSFGKYTDNYEFMQQALATYTSRCAEKLRKQNSVCGQIQVIVQTNSWNTKEKQYFNSICCKLDIPTSHTPTIIKFAIKGLESIFKTGFTYKRVGIMLMDLRDKSDGTQNLFVQEHRFKNDKIMNVIDRINKMNGTNSIRYGTMGYNSEKWKMKQNLLTRCYTTRISDLIKIY